MQQDLMVTDEDVGDVCSSMVFAGIIIDLIIPNRCTVGKRQSKLWDCICYNLSVVLIHISIGKIRPVLCMLCR